MAKFVNAESGSVINVDDETAAQLGPEWKKGDASKASRPSAQANTFGVAANAAPVESEAEPAQGDAEAPKKSASKK